ETAAAGGKSASSKTPTLDQLGVNLTAMAKAQQLDPVIGREKEIERVIQILSRRTKNNPALIGEPGVGKTAIAEGLAHRIVKGDVPETLQGKRVLTLDIGSLVAGTKYRGEFEERLKKIIEEPSIEETQAILMGIRSRYEDHHKVSITEDAVKASAELSSRYITDRFLPDKAIDLMDEAASRVRLRYSTVPTDVKDAQRELD